MKNILLILFLLSLFSCHEEKSDVKEVMTTNIDKKAIVQSTVIPKRINLHVSSIWTTEFGLPMGNVAIGKKGWLLWQDKYLCKVRGDSLLTNDSKGLYKGKILFATYDTLILDMVDDKKVDTLFYWKDYMH